MYNATVEESMRQIQAAHQPIELGVPYFEITLSEHNSHGLHVGRGVTLSEVYRASRHVVERNGVSVKAIQIDSVHIRGEHLRMRERVVENGWIRIHRSLADIVRVVLERKQDIVAARDLHLDHAFLQRVLLVLQRPFVIEGAPPDGYVGAPGAMWVTRHYDVAAKLDAYLAAHELAADVSIEDFHAAEQRGVFS